MGKKSLSLLLKSVLAAIKPTKEHIRKEQSLALEIMKKLRKQTSAKVVLTGSIAKNTFLKDNKDIDVFLLYPRALNKSSFKSLVENTVKKAFPKSSFLISYAEHPYVQLTIEGRRIDIVPAYNIKSSAELQSAVDRSVLHTAYILRTLTKKQRDDVLLLKKFLRSVELYGAEIKVQGFSGYLCELLILYYGSFVGFLKTVSRYKLPVFVDMKNFYKNNEEKRARIKKLNHSFIVIDPTDKNRNVAAAVSEENIKKLTILARKFIKNPSERFFSNPKTFKEKIISLKNAYLVTFAKPIIVDDILWGQLRRLERQLTVFLKQHGFEARTLFDVGESVNCAISFTITRLPDTMLKKGPLLSLKEHVIGFKKAHKNKKFSIKKGRIYVSVHRPIKTAENALSEFFKSVAMPSHLDKTTLRIKKR